MLGLTVGSAKGRTWRMGEEGDEKTVQRRKGGKEVQHDMEEQEWEGRK